MHAWPPYIAAPLGPARAAYVNCHIKQIHGKDKSCTQLQAQITPKRSEWKDAMLLSIPTVFDLIATILMNIGLLTVTASVYQMMRGAEMIFAALFAILFLGRRLNQLHYTGIACCCVGIATVGMASVLSGKGGTQVPVSKGQIILGMTLIVMSQCVQAAQITFEDYFMSEMAISPMKIVGYEGVIGACIMLLVFMPIVRVLPGASLPNQTAACAA